jgi:hypothetical protein
MRGVSMNYVFWLISVIVVVIAVLSFLGLALRPVKLLLGVSDRVQRRCLGPLIAEPGQHRRGLR